MLDAKPLLFIDHDQTQVTELDVFGNQTVRPDGDINRPRNQPGFRFIDLLSRCKPRQFSNSNWKPTHPFAKTLKVLLG